MLNYLCFCIDIVINDIIIIVMIIMINHIVNMFKVRNSIIHCY